MPKEAEYRRMNASESLLSSPGMRRNAARLHAKCLLTDFRVKRMVTRFFLCFVPEGPEGVIPEEDYENELTQNLRLQEHDTATIQKEWTPEGHWAWSASMYRELDCVDLKKKQEAAHDDSDTEAYLFGEIPPGGGDAGDTGPTSDFNTADAASMEKEDMPVPYDYPDPAVEPISAQIQGASAKHAEPSVDVELELVETPNSESPADPTEIPSDPSLTLAEAAQLCDSPNEAIVFPDGSSPTKEDHDSGRDRPQPMPKTLPGKQKPGSKGGSQKKSQVGKPKSKAKPKGKPKAKAAKCKPRPKARTNGNSQPKARASKKKAEQQDADAATSNPKALKALKEKELDLWKKLHSASWPNETYLVLEQPSI